MTSATIVFHPLSSENGGGVAVYSPVFEVADIRHLTAVLDVQDLGGTAPVLTASIEQSMDGQSWLPLAGFVGATSATKEAVTPSDFARFLRAKYEYSGTSAWFTFSLIGVVRG